MADGLLDDNSKHSGGYFMSDTPKFLTTADAAKFLKVSEASIRRWSDQGKLKCYRIGGRSERRFLESDILVGIEKFGEKEEPNHISFFFRNEKDQLDTLIPVLADYLKNGHRVLYIRDSTAEKKMYLSLEEQGINVKESVEKGSLKLFDSSEVYLKDGHFDMDRVFTFWEDALQESIKMGFSKVFCSGEMTWYLTQLPGVEKMMEYEDRLNLVTDKYPQATIVCQYDLNRLSGSVIIEAVLCHPLVMLENRSYQGFYGSAG